jgi:hypothetical protein
MRIKYVDNPIASRIFAALLTVIASYFGYQKVEEHRNAQPAGDVKVDVKVEAPAGGSHSHAPVLTRIEIQTLIDKAISAQHEKDVQVFKHKEPWEKGGG